MRVAMRSTPSSECFRFSRCSALVAIGPGLASLFGDLIVSATDASIWRARATAWADSHSGGRSRPTRPHGPPGAPASEKGPGGQPPYPGQRRGAP